MADMHVLTGDNGEWRVVMHFPVPASNNSAGISWQDAVANSGLGGTTSLPDGDGTGGTISADEKAAVLAGSRIEHAANFRIESGGNVQATLRQFYTSEKANIQADLQRRLKWFGKTESEA